MGRKTGQLSSSKPDLVHEKNRVILIVKEGGRVIAELIRPPSRIVYGDKQYFLMIYDNRRYRFAAICEYALKASGLGVGSSTLESHLRYLQEEHVLEVVKARYRCLKNMLRQVMKYSFRDWVSPPSFQIEPYPGFPDQRLVTIKMHIRSAADFCFWRSFDGMEEILCIPRRFPGHLYNSKEVLHINGTTDAVVNRDNYGIGLISSPPEGRSTGADSDYTWWQMKNPFFCKGKSFSFTINIYRGLTSESYGLVKTILEAVRPSGQCRFYIGVSGGFMAPLAPFQNVRGESERHLLNKHSGIRDCVWQYVYHLQNHGKDYELILPSWFREHREKYIAAYERHYGKKKFAELTR